MKKGDNYMNLSKYMDWAINIAQKSEDPNTKVGACIVDKNGNIIGQGYNKFPNGCEDQFPWDREGNSSLDTKYPYICHAELNAILEAMSKSGGKLNNCTIFVTLFPCNECAKLIVQSGIEKVVYLSDKYYYTENVIASKRIFNKALIPTYSILETVKMF